MGRGALLALGIMPYVTARIYLRLWRIVAPGDYTTVRRQQLVRRLTLGFSMVQSYGFAKFLESLPVAVANPGPRFVQGSRRRYSPQRKDSSSWPALHTVLPTRVESDFVSAFD